MKENTNEEISQTVYSNQHVFEKIVSNRVFEKVVMSLYRWSAKSHTDPFSQSTKPKVSRAHRPTSG
jgi:hypothetical protein